ncbi:MAG: response regulator [Deltaproteobacteria bacterium]|nr:response regulator [Deltaproteobacteria bacterium]
MLKVLIIDDEESIRDSFSFYLEDLNYTVFTAENGERGVELFKDILPDIVLVDLRMPKMDGMEVLANIHSSSPETPVIVISGTGEINDALEALRAGAWDFLTKPISNLGVLKHAIDDKLKKASLIRDNKQQLKDLKYSNDQLEKMAKEAWDAKREAEASNRSKSEFMAVITHDLRTPLNGISGLTDLLLMNSPTEKQVKYLNMIKTSGNNLLSLVNNILDYSKIEANKIKLEQIEFNIRDLLKEIIDHIFTIADEKGLKLELEIDENIPEIIIGDSSRLRQIVTNLLSNAIKFTETGFVKVGISLKEQKNKSAEFQVIVEDTGIGFDQSKALILFEEFTQAEQSTTRKYGGTGLGLAIVKKLVKLLDGEISVESEPGKGSTFGFTFKMNLP